MSFEAMSTWSSLGYWCCSCCYKLQHPLMLFVFSLLIISQSQGVVCDVEFIESPQNKTVEFGDIAEFECRVQNCTSTLQLWINGTIDVENDRLENHGLDPREYGFNISCKTESGEKQHVALFWMFVNNRTIQAVRYVMCKLISVQGIDGVKAYIDLLQIPDTTILTTSDEGTNNDTMILCANNVVENFNRAQTVISNALWLSITFNLLFALSIVMITLS